MNQQENGMAAIVGAHHTSFTVARLEPSLEFFRDHLGLELLFTREIRTPYFDRIVGLPGCAVKAAMLRIPNSGHHVELFEYLQPAGRAHQPRPCDPGSAHLALLVDDLRALSDKLRERGVPNVGEPVSIDAGPNRGAQALYLSDPNGILIELFQPPKPATP
jgi:catechol 2,3-dioxygenase-like lactoylglutathione lyase family enzyme